MSKAVAFVQFLRIDRWLDFALALAIGLWCI